MRYFLMFLLVLGGGVQCLAAVEKPIRFAGLSEGDEVEVKLLSFRLPGSQSAYEFAFRSSTNASVSVVKLELEGPRVGDLPMTNRLSLFATLTNRVTLGSLSLSREDLLGLDVLMEFYRQRLPKCVTDFEDFVIVTHRHNGQIVTVENFHDETGGVYTENLKGVRDFFTLQYRLERSLQKTKR